MKHPPPSSSHSNSPSPDSHLDSPFPDFDQDSSLRSDTLLSPAGSPSDSSAPAVNVNPKCIYGPVHSWRFGRSLGIDLLLETSICSFRCVYCQLGKIHRWTTEQRVYTPTEKVLEDLRGVKWEEVDVVTLSGSGEPTLALNLGEVIERVKEISGKSVMILTNSTMFHDAATRQRAARADRIVCKLDAATQKALEKMNRPAEGVCIERIVEGLKKLREEYRGILSLQCMFLPSNLSEADGLARIAAAILPDEIQINTPRRPHPSEWQLTSRGSDDPSLLPDGRSLPRISAGEIDRIEALFRSAVPQARILKPKA